MKTTRPIDYLLYTLVFNVETHSPNNEMIKQFDFLTLKTDVKNF